MLLQHPHQARRGVILMVVLSMLTLFAIVGVTFVLYATSEAASMRAQVASETLFVPDWEPEMNLSVFLNQLIYDVPDPTSNNPDFSYSAMRGHSLARSEYGYSGPGGQDNMAFSGVGRLSFTAPNVPTMGDASTLPAAYNSTAYIVNFQPFMTAGVLTDGFLLDPERVTSTIWRTSTAPDATSVYTGGANLPYTYPDHQNMFLAMVRSDGAVLMPSFHRPWLFGIYDDDNTTPSPTYNANTRNNVGKYLTCFVRPADMGAGFPKPDANFLSVKNLGNAPGGNDSGWVDIGAPVMTAPNGQKYKMLIAPLIMELDSRLDLNTLGNVIGANGAHASYQGWGPTEVNISKILNSGAAPNEWQNIFLGNAPSTLGTQATSRTLGRYGFNRLPQGPSLAAGTSARAWGQVDYNGTNDPPQGALPTSPTMLLPASGSATVVPYQVFPTFSTASFGNGTPNETQTAAGVNVHPLAYDAYRPLRDNRRIPLASLMPLLRNGDTNSDALTSELHRLCPQNFLTDNTAATSTIPAVTVPALNTTRRRNLVTLLSADLLRPAATPYIIDPTDTVSTPISRYQFSPTYDATTYRWLPTYPSGQATIPYPSATQPPAAAPPPTPGILGDFNTNLRSTLARIGRVDLNRQLTTYPTPNATTGIIDTTVAANVTQYQQAVTDRQQFASDLFLALRRATGTLDPATITTAFTVNSPEYAACRFLAQIAVNIVDYIDYDDYITPFQWDTTNGAWVYGTEIPRLLLNEFYVSYDNDAADTGLPAKATTHYNCNVWLELLNPFPVGTTGTPENVPNSPWNTWPDKAAILDNGTSTPYQVVLCNPDISSTLRNPANVLGDPNFGLAMGMTNVLSTVGTATAGYDPLAGNSAGLVASPTGDYRVVMPSINAYQGTSTTGPPAVANGGFYVLGPDVKFVNAAVTPGLPVTTVRPEMSIQVPVGNAGANVPLRPTILLRRLLCPGLPPNTTTTSPTYNPYITIDYTEIPPPNPTGTPPVAQQVNDGRIANGCGILTPGAITTFKSYGRVQPYSGTSLNGQRQAQVPNPVPANQPLNTFFRQNAVEGTPPPAAGTMGQTLQIPFDWLVHLDRQLISPMELLHVSAYKPHELTQQFVDGSATAPHFGHRVPWYDQTARLYRFFEFVDTKSRAAGMALGGRVPGRININMVWDQDILQALADPQPSNYFNAYDVYVAFNQMIQQRSPTSDGAGGQMPGGGDHPFWGFSVGQAAGGDAMGPTARGIDQSFLRPYLPNFAGGPTFLPAQAGAWPGLTFDPFPTNLNGGMITNATMANPIQITTSANHGLVTGQRVVISMVGGTTAANNTTTQPTWVVTKVDATNFTISDPTTGATVDGTMSGAYVMMTGTWTPVGAIHPYQRYEMLTKIYNNLTTRSNVFAVWITCGFFEVTDTTTTPVKLGAEIGSAEGRQIRHRCFAIVDRSQMQAFSTTMASAITTTGSQMLPLTAYTGTNPSTGRTWSVQQDTVLTIEPTINGTIINATNATPIQITSNNHGLVTGQSITIGGVGGNTNANGTWTVSVVDANNFNIVNPSTGMSVNGNAAYTASTGTWATTNEETIVVQSPPNMTGAVMTTTGAGVSPIQITTTAAHNLTTGQIVSISNVGGNTAANGVWQVTVTGATTFTIASLTGVTPTGNANYTAGGTWAVLQATFTKGHPAGAPVINRGNPGPWSRYDPRKDPLVVPFFAVIH
jgi:hypothetical protein